MADTDDGGVEEIEQAEELVARVAAIDIAKASGMVCVRVPHEDQPGKRVQRVFNTVATSGAILDRTSTGPGGDASSNRSTAAARRAGEELVPAGPPRTN